MGAASLTAPTSGKMHVDAVGGFGGWSVGCAIKRGGRWDRAKVQQATEHYDDDGHGKDIGSRLLLLAAAINMAAKAFPPQVNRCRRTKRRGTERKYSQHCVVQSQMDTELQPIKT